MTSGTSLVRTRVNLAGWVVTMLENKGMSPTGIWCGLHGAISRNLCCMQCLTVFIAWCMDISEIEMVFSWVVGWLSISMSTHGVAGIGVLASSVSLVSVLGEVALISGGGDEPK